MKKIFASMIAVAFLAGCVEEGDDLTQDYTTVCIHGVEYLHRASGHKGYLAPRIDAETLQPRRCE